MWHALTLMAHLLDDDDAIELDLPGAHRLQLFASAFLATRRTLYAILSYVRAFFMDNLGDA